VILVDTNILVAVANDRDNNHDEARELLEGTTDALLVTPTVIAEVCYLLSERAGGAAAEVRFLRSFGTGELDLAGLTLSDVARMAELAETYADLGLGGTDASIVAVAERLNITGVATFDRRHFTVVRPNHVDAFTLLPG
jgi:predicted nucleic acid-binding protein